MSEEKVEKDLGEIKQSLAELKQELREFVVRLTTGQSYRDPRIRFFQPSSARLDKPLD